MTFNKWDVKSDNHCIHGVLSHQECSTCLRELMRRNREQREMFEKCEAVGLKVTELATNYPDTDFWVRAADVQRLLSDGVTVYGSPAHGLVSPGPIAWDHTERMTDTHKGLLIGIKPTAPPVTAEGLLREYTNRISNDSHEFRDWEKRVREYLGRKA